TGIPAAPGRLSCLAWPRARGRRVRHLAARPAYGLAVTSAAMPRGDLLRDHGTGEPSGDCIGRRRIPYAPAPTQACRYLVRYSDSKNPIGPACAVLSVGRQTLPGSGLDGGFGRADPGPGPPSGRPGKRAG